MTSAHLFQQYWQLTRFLLLPTRFLRGLCLLMITALAAVALLADQPMAYAVAGAVIFFILVPAGLALPGQILALASSKQFQLLDDLRKKIFIISALFWLGTSLLGSSALAALEPLMEFESLLPMLLFGVSLVLCITVVTGALYSPAAPFVPAIALLLLSLTGSWTLLTAIPSSFLWCAVLLIWVAFYRWLLTWKPQHFLTNPILTMGVTEPSSWPAPRARNPLPAPTSLSGSLLLGASDNLLRNVMAVALGSLPVILLFGFMRSPQSNPIPAPLYLSIVLYLFSVHGMSLIVTISQRLASLWMNCNHSRAGMFNFVEKFYGWRAALLFGLTALLLVPLTLVLVNTPASVFQLLYAAVIGGIFSAFNFYLSVLLYTRRCLFFSAVVPVATLLFIPLALCLAFLGLWGSNGVPPLGPNLFFLAVFISLVLIARRCAKSAWQRIDFQRLDR